MSERWLPRLAAWDDPANGHTHLSAPPHEVTCCGRSTLLMLVADREEGLRRPFCPVCHPFNQQHLQQPVREV
jgi:hypothetical protein